MFIFAYLLFSNMAFTAGVLFALLSQSRHRQDEMPGVRPTHRQPNSPTHFLRTRQTPESTQPR